MHRSIAVIHTKGGKSMIEQLAYSHVAKALAGLFDCLYYVEIETGKYVEFVSSKMLADLHIPSEGEDFFKLVSSSVGRYVYPADLDRVMDSHNRDIVVKELERDGYYAVFFRLIMGGKIIHVRHLNLMCEDGKHIICGLENVEEEYQKKKEQDKILKSAERMARRDELTGIKNKNAFTEHAQTLDESLRSAPFEFGVVMCDVNDLKMINDTRGHSFGDEVIQRTSRMICSVFKHSPVFRVGGDEFAAIITDSDYAHREELLQELRNMSMANARTRSGPIVATGMAVFERGRDKCVSDVYDRADIFMYENKNELKTRNLTVLPGKNDNIFNPIPLERKQQLDSLFGALFTVAGEGYVYLNDMKYDYSRLSLPFVDDFGLESEYLYHVDQVLKEFVHPDDAEVFEEACETVLRTKAELLPVTYRIRKANGKYTQLRTRGFVLSGDNGEPEYFGGIMYEA